MCTSPVAHTTTNTASDIGWRFACEYATAVPDGHVAVQATWAPAPQVVVLNHALAQELGLDLEAVDSATAAQLFSGNMPPAAAYPIAQAYAGHQFGQFSPRLGDGRALLWGEHTVPNGACFDIALKGSGPTPFARGGDGFAALGPMLREYLMGEAMHALGIPGTRALAVVKSGRSILRQGPATGAVLTRVALSHIRVGSLQYFAARGDVTGLRQVARLAIARHDPELLQAYAADDPVLYLKWFEVVLKRQAALIAQWQQVGFIHGVMNTDNMALSGQTIDYGPCAWMDTYDTRTCFSSIDHGGRYAFGQQPGIGAWNLARFAESLLPLLEVGDTVDQLNISLAGFEEHFNACCLQGMRGKLGLTEARLEDTNLSQQLLALLQAQQADHTLALRYLAEAAMGHEDHWLALLQTPQAGRAWLKAWHTRWRSEGVSAHAVAHRIQAQNPLYIARNYQVEAALQQAEAGDLGAYTRLVQVLEQPFTERKGLEEYTQPAPAGFSAAYQTFCGT